MRLQTWVLFCWIGTPCLFALFLCLAALGLAQLWGLCRILFCTPALSTVPQTHGLLSWTEDKLKVMNPTCQKSQVDCALAPFSVVRSCHSPGSLLLRSWAGAAASDTSPSTHPLGVWSGSFSGASADCISSNFVCFSIKASIPDMDRTSDSCRKSHSTSHRVQKAEKQPKHFRFSLFLPWRRILSTEPNWCCDHLSKAPSKPMPLYSHLPQTLSGSLISPRNGFSFSFCHTLPHTQGPWEANLAENTFILNRDPDAGKSFSRHLSLFWLWRRSQVPITAGSTSWLQMPGAL